MGKEGSGKPLLVLGAAGALAVAGALCYFAFPAREAQVSGKVMLDSKPVPGALVAFIGADEGNEAPVAVQADDAGNYRLMGNQGGGIRPGKYQVVVTKLALKDGTVPVGERLLQARAKGLLLNFLPKVYEERSTTPLQFDVAGGSHTIDLDLKKRP